MSCTDLNDSRLLYRQRLDQADEQLLNPNNAQQMCTGTVSHVVMATVRLRSDNAATSSIQDHHAGEPGSVSDVVLLGKPFWDLRIFTTYVPQWE